MVILDDEYTAVLVARRHVVDISYFEEGEGLIGDLFHGDQGYPPPGVPMNDRDATHEPVHTWCLVGGFGAMVHGVLVDPI